VTTSFRVYGSPAPQGSKTRVGKVMLEGRDAAQRERIKAWRQDVAEAARNAHEGPPLAGPLRVRIDFRMKRPKSKPRDVWAPTAPDWDKIARNTCDALTAAGVIVDDRLIVKATVTKRLADAVDPWTGADITVAEMAGPA
jgi:Holliday junction resolvase RusA-like endonuclease